MKNEQNSISNEEASEALKSINVSKHDVIGTNQPPALIILFASISYAAIVFGWGMTEHDNIWALAMWIGGFGFAISMGLYFYTYRILGVKPSIIPKSASSIKLNIIIGLIFAALTIASRELRILGLEFAPHLASLFSGVIFFIMLKNILLANILKGSKIMATLNAIIHAPNRLQICAILATSAELEFKLIKEQLDVSDSVLSKHLKVLEESSYILLKKRSEFGRPRTWISLTSEGRKAFNNHVSALKAIVG